jgi:hypothetical protein
MPPSLPPSTMSRTCQSGRGSPRNRCFAIWQAASALLYVPAWMLGRLPLLRFYGAGTGAPAIGFRRHQCAPGVERGGFSLGLEAGTSRRTADTTRAPAGARTFRAGEIVRMDGVTSEDVYVFARRLARSARDCARPAVRLRAGDRDFGRGGSGVSTPWRNRFNSLPARGLPKCSLRGEHTVVAGEISGALGFYGNRLRVEDVSAGPRRRQRRRR